MTTSNQARLESELKEKAETTAQRQFLRGWYDAAVNETQPTDSRWAYTQGYAVGITCKKIRDRYLTEKTEDAKNNFAWGEKYYEDGYSFNPSWNEATANGYNARREIGKYRAPLLAAVRQIEGERRVLEQRIATGE